jgi:hypothetical protein
MSRAFPQHDWEEPDAPVAHAWDDDRDGDDEGWGNAFSDDENGPADPRAIAALEFLDILGAMFMESKISAQSYCLLCFYASKAGVGGDVNKHGMGPGRPSGHYSRHLKTVFGFGAFSPLHYTMDVPGHAKHDLSRTSHALQVVPPHELVAADIIAKPELIGKLQTAFDNHDLPPTYYDNPVVQASPTPPMPLGLYLDGVPYSLTDTVVGVWLINLIDDSRHIIAIIRKRVTCRCGCRGWCTFYPFMLWLHYCFSCLAEGLFPQSRHDAKPWSKQDATRAMSAGSPLGCRGILLQLRGDWAEFCERLGYPNWRSFTRPCICCSSTPDALYTVQGVSLVDSPWHDNLEQDYADSCTRCEIKVIVTHVSVRQIRLLLRYDKRRAGALGRALTRPFPELNLLLGDRIEPSPSMPDVAGFDFLCPEPGDTSEVLFWRRSEETICLHRFPLWDDVLGISPTRTLCFDLLHTMYLGVMQGFVKLILWRLLMTGVWGAFESNDEESFKVAVMCLRHELFRWYEVRARSHRHENLTRLADLVPNMLGSRHDHALKTKVRQRNIGQHYRSAPLQEQQQKQQR